MAYKKVAELSQKKQIMKEVWGWIIYIFLNETLIKVKTFTKHTEAFEGTECNYSIH